MEQSLENLAHCGLVLCFNDSVYLKKMRQDITSSSTYIDIFFSLTNNKFTNLHTMIQSCKKA